MVDDELRNMILKVADIVGSKCPVDFGINYGCENKNCLQCFAEALRKDNNND